MGSQGINFVILGTFTCLIPQTFVCLSCGLKKITIKQKQVLTCLPPFPLKFHANPVCVDICYYNYNYFDYYYFCYYSQIVSTVFLVWSKFQFVTFYHFRYFYIHIILDWVALSPAAKKKFSWALKKTFFTMREIKIFKSEGSWNCSTSLSKGKEKNCFKF